MIKHTTLFLLLLFLYSNILLHAQTDKQKAFMKHVEAASLMDKGRYDESLQLLREALTLDTGNFSILYEMGYANYLKKDYKEAIQILDKNRTHKDVTDKLFQILGNSYDISGDPGKAIEIYDEGLKKFPASGVLFLEKGNVFWNKREFGKALSFYEAGIRANPGFPSNYYSASRIYCSSTESVWGMIYGEIFMNLEPNTKRTAEIGKLLFDKYVFELKPQLEGKFKASFCRRLPAINQAQDPTAMSNSPYCNVYDTVLQLSMEGITQITTGSLDSLRKNFIKTYYKLGYDKSNPNILFTYHKKLIDAGHFEAYNYWLLMKGDEEAFFKWQAANKAKWDSFMLWFPKNKLIVDKNNTFYSGQN